ncbi:MAG: hypothetical protein ABI678_24445 [Kofleriaceae bacterium]
MACEAPPPAPAPVVATFEVAPAPSVWPLGKRAGWIGRGVAPQPVTARAILGRDVPLGAAAVWSIDGAGAAMAVATHGTTVELIDVDGARLVWRATCDAPVVGASAAGIVCGDDRGVTVLDLNGKAKWHHAGQFVAMTGARAVVKDGDAVTVLDLVKGAQVEQVTVPAGASVLATCERTLVVALADHRLAKLVDGKQTWAVATAPLAVTPKPPTRGTPVSSDALVGVDGCSAALLVRVEGVRGSALVAIAETGKLLGRVDDLRGWWIARDDPQRVEISTRAGVASWDRALVEPRGLELPPLGPLLATRGERRLVRVSAHAVAVIDRKGTRAYVELAGSTAALGDEAVLVGGAALRTFRIPPPWTHAIPRAGASAAVEVVAELRDLPATMPLVLDAATTWPGPDRSITAIAIAGAAVVVDADQALARLELAPARWSWRIDTAPIVALAASAQLAVSATATEVIAVGPDGARRWHRSIVADAIEVAGELALVHAGGRAIVIDATGAALGELETTTATILELRGMTVVVAAEHGRIVARLPRAWMLPVWSVEVAGVVASVARTGGGVILALDDGDAYRLDAVTGAAAALPAIGLAWHADDDLVTGETAGGPIPPSPIVPPPAGKPEVYKPTDLETAPAIATPWPPPPPMPASLQLTLFEPTGALRVRDDYPVTGAITPAVRSAGAPLVIRAGRDALVIDPRRGDPLRRVTLPDDLAPLFSTVVDGKPVVGTILTTPLRAVVF